MSLPEPCRRKRNDFHHELSSGNREARLSIPTSQIKLHDKKSSYYDVISSLEFPECNQALKTIVERIDEDKIYQLITDLPNASKCQKRFYQHMLNSRLRLILKETYGIIYSIGLLSYTIWEDDSFRYEFTPNWSVIDLLKPPHFQGVPGFDLSTRKSTYLRENIEPIFISERTPARNREDAW